MATAFLADFFALVGEAQPGAIDIHYTPISYNDIYAQYKVYMHADR